MDLWCSPPYHIDTRHIDYGLLKRIYDKDEEQKKSKKRPEHGHCIIGFVKSDLL